MSDRALHLLRNRNQDRTKREGTAPFIPCLNVRRGVRGSGRCEPKRSRSVGAPVRTGNWPRFCSSRYTILLLTTERDLVESMSKSVVSDGHARHQNALLRFLGALLADSMTIMMLP